MAAVLFVVEATFELPGMRRGVLVSGRLAAGEVARGMTLWNQRTREPVLVLGVEFATPAALREGWVALVVGRKDAAAMVPGTVLTDTE